jgi:CubicO group peptidase (beta-lactamase class C family)
VYFQVKDQRTAGLVIVQDGKIRLEKYGLDFSADGCWTSFSVAKSFTSTLVGAAIKDGYIKSINDKVSFPISKGRCMTMSRSSSF